MSSFSCRRPSFALHCAGYREHPFILSQEGFMPAVIFQIVLIFVLCLPAQLSAQTAPAGAQNNGSAAVKEDQVAKGKRNTGAALSNIINQINISSRELSKKEQELKRAVGEERKRALEEEVAELVERLDELSAGFMRIAAGIDRDVLDPEKQEPLDVATELEELLAPLIMELKGLTERPREIERMRTKIQSTTNKLERIVQAEERLNALLEEVEEKDVVKRLSGVAETLKRQREQLESDRDFTEFQLEEYLLEEPSVFDAISRIIKTFFQTRGKNLLMALGAFLGVILFMRALAGFLHGPIEKRLANRYGFTLRIMGVGFIVLEYLGAFAAALVVFYVVGDWVLLGISIILIMGLVWSAKQGFAKYWEQGKVLLNLGPVRKGERVIYNGLPWRVTTLNYYSHLTNPALAGGRIRVPLDDMLEMVSRPFVQDEPWFPTKRDDWVVLSDETMGKVIMQTPEIVQLLTWGESRKTYSTLDFLAMNPKNLSTGWNHYFTFGVDYAHQALVTEEIPQILCEAIRKGLEEAGFGEHLKSMGCEFAEAGASSLDIAIYTNFTGDIPEKYFATKRAINKACVDACNTYGWVIPFTQVTVHRAELEALPESAVLQAQAAGKDASAERSREKTSQAAPFEGGPLEGSPEVVPGDADQG
jgi:Skp family chaperone for outer membrane proteins